MYRSFILVIVTLVNLGGIGRSAHAQIDCAYGWRAMGVPQPANLVFEAIRWNDGGGEKLYLGGFTASFPGGIQSWDGYNWEQLGSGISGGSAPTPLVDGLAVFENSLIVGGAFARAGGVDALNVARWTGTQWLPMGGGIRQGQTGIYALHVHDGQLYAAGERLADSAGDPGAPCLHRWNGVEWEPMPVEPWWGIATAFVSHGGALHAAVGVSPGEGSSAVFRWDGTAWTTVSDQWANDTIWAMATYQGHLFAGGSFNAMGGNAISRVARLNGSAWEGLGTGVSGSFQIVYGFGVFGGELIVAGDFDRVGGLLCSNLGAWNGSQWRCFEGGAPGPFAYSTLVMDDELLVTGQFGNATFPRNVGRWGRPISPADIDQDFDVDLADLAILLSDFGTSDTPPRPGDTDADGDIDLQDLATLLAHFGESCP